MKKFLCLFFLSLLFFTLVGCTGYTDEELEAAKATAYNEGYEAGYLEGRENGLKTSNETEYEKGFWDGAKSGIDVDEYFEFMASDAPTSEKIEKSEEILKLQTNRPE